MKRRTFLRTGIGLTIAITAGCSLPVIPKRPDATFSAATGWIHFYDDSYLLYLPRAEMGQNIATALKQIACEELGIEWNELTLQLPTTKQIDRVKATVGSESVKDFAIPLAQACATLRDAILNGYSADQIVANERPLHQLRSFASATRFVGGRVPIEHLDEIVRGLPLYAADIRRPQMIYGRVLRAPTSPEIVSRPVHWNETAASQQSGFVALVHDSTLVQGNSTGIGILAATPGALDRISEALAIQWKIGDAFDQGTVQSALDIDNRLRNGSLGHNIQNDALSTSDPWDIDLRIDISAAAHAAIETRAAVAEFSSETQLRVWAGNQDVFYVRDIIAKTLGLDIDNITIQSMRLGGGFGGRTLCTVELEAALLARAAGRPVKVQWTRAQELQYGFHRPPSSHRVRVALRNGRIDRWWHAFASGHILFTNAAMPRWLQNIAGLIGDPGVARGADMPYRSHRRCIEFDQVRLPILTGPWRGLGAGPNGLVIESAIDECAHRLQEDPLAFRLKHLDDPRLRKVLETVAIACDWTGSRNDDDKSTSQRAGWGIACGIYKEHSYAAVAAHVQVSKNGDIRITHIVCAHDCGLVINPDQVRSQCEGNLVWGIGMALTDQLPIDDSQISASNFDRAPVLRISRVPTMTVKLVTSTEPPAGAGETVISASTGAIANAIRQATGIRATRFPVAPGQLALRS